MSFLIMVLLISLLLTSLDCATNEGSSLTSCLDLLDRLFRAVFFGKSPHIYLYFACLFLLAAYLLVPMGSLPPYSRAPAGMILLLFLIVMAQSAYIRGVKHYSSDIYQRLDDVEHSALSRCSIAYIIVGSCFGWYILSRGIPGSIFSLGSPTAMPFWPLAGIPGKAGLICFFFMLAIVSPGRRPENATLYGEIPLLEVYGALRSCLCPAVTVSFLIPYNPAITFGLHSHVMYVADFIFFWLKVLTLQILIFPYIRRGYSALSEKPREKMKYVIEICLGLSGAVLMIADIWK